MNIIINDYVVIMYTPRNYIKFQNLLRQAKMYILAYANKDVSPKSLLFAHTSIVYKKILLKILILAFHGASMFA